MKSQSFFSKHFSYFLFISIIFISINLITSVSATETGLDSTENAKFILYLYVILMITFLLISLKYSEWGIIAGIIWLFVGLDTVLPLNTTLGLIVISIGMFIMLYGVYELFKR
jgi:hypothetical protein